MRILGLDPGSRRTGVGIIEDGKFVHATTLQLGDGPMPERLSLIFVGLKRLIAEYRPKVAAVETVFMSRNPQAAIKLGQARGAAICAAVEAGLEIHEYAPRAIKQAVVGRGGADKQQVQHMIGVLMQINCKLDEDAHDALAVALCHHHIAQTARRLPDGVVLR